MHLNSFLASSLMAFITLVSIGCGHDQAVHPAASATATSGNQPHAAGPPSGNPLPTAAAASPANVPATEGSKLLNDPTGVDLFFLQYAISGMSPAFPDLAKLDPAVRSANEFGRADALAKAEAQLRARANAVRGTTLLQVNLNDSFGDYDPKYKEYEFQMGFSNVVLTYQAFGRQIDLALANRGLAQAWKLDPAEAEDVLHRTGGDRHVMLLLKLQVLDAPPAVNGAPLRLNTRVLEYEIKSAFKNIKLGNVIVGK